MKTIKFSKLFVSALYIAVFVSISLFAQENKIPKSLRASVSQKLGLDTELTFDFGRPGVKGRTIWGELVPWGLTPGNKYSNGKPFPWRAGANENTIFTTNKDILVEGKKLPAGNYGLHMIPGENEFIVIFSTNDSLWGSYQYNEKEDALRIKVAPKLAENNEWLTFGFEDLAGTSATAFLHWEKLKIPFNIKVSN